MRDSTGADTTRPGPVARPKIGRPDVRVLVDFQVPELYRVVCRECPYSEGPSVQTYVRQLATRHRQRHRAGELPAPFHGHIVGAES